MKTKILINQAVIILLSMTISYAQNGGQLFLTTCGACHSIGKGKLVGPDLKGVQDRHSEEWILKWVKGSQGLVKSGDKDAMKLFADNNQVIMPDQPLKDNEIKSVLAYIKAGGEPVTASATQSVLSSRQDQIGQAVQNAAASEKDGSSLINMFSFTNYLVIFLIGICLLVIWILSLSLKSVSEQLKNNISGNK
jgi:cytochrome c2